MLRVLKRVQIYGIFFYCANIFQKKFNIFISLIQAKIRNMLTLITNGQILTPKGWLKNFDILFDQKQSIFARNQQ
jgi:hypothetical protein